MDVVDSVADAMNFRAVLNGEASVFFRDAGPHLREMWRDIARLHLWALLVVAPVGVWPEA